ncbi:hypothetical protein BH09ACT13_BH09ACT13_13050 [soil metagenome]
MVETSEHGEASADECAPIASRARWLPVILVGLGVMAFATWVISPRFTLQAPSLVDDWWAISPPAEELHPILGVQGRFRPGWDLWFAVQWSTLDAPRGLVGPNVWNVARIASLVFGLCVMTALTFPAPTRRREALLQAGLAACPALLVVQVPEFARDLARFGPQEPLLLGGMTLGGSLLVLAARSLIDANRPLQRWQTVALALAGGSLWVLGMYHKETSLAAAPLVAAVLYAGRARRKGWSSLATRRRLSLLAIAAVVALPLAHVVVESLLILARGDLVYGAKIDAGRGILSGLRELWDGASKILPPVVSLVAGGAVLLIVIVSVLRRRFDTLALGALASGALTIVVAAQTGVAAPRYYLPAYALLAIALSLSVARLARVVQLLVLALVLGTAVTSTAARDEVRRWAEIEEAEAAVVRAVADLEPECVVALAGVDLERTYSLPALVAFERDPARRKCTTSGVHFVTGQGAEGRALLAACAPRALAPVLEAGRFLALHRCSRLHARAVRDPSFGLVDPEELVELRRLRAPRRT